MRLQRARSQAERVLRVTTASDAAQILIEDGCGVSCAKLMPAGERVIFQSSTPPRTSTPSSRTCRRIWRLQHHDAPQKFPAVRIQKSRTALLLDHPFFGSLLFRLGDDPSTSVRNHGHGWRVSFLQPELCRDAKRCGTCRGSGPRSDASRTPASHAPGWPQSQHVGIWPATMRSIPCSSMPASRLPKDVLIEHRFRGMSAEQIYNLIEEQETEPSQETSRRCSAAHAFPTTERAFRRLR